MGTVEKLLKELDAIIADMAKLDWDDDAARREIARRADKNRIACKQWIESPSVIRNLQDKPQPTR